MTELLLSQDAYRVLAWAWIAIAAVTFVLLFRISAPYGRHLRSGWGPTVPARWAWMVMESPALWWTGGVVLLAGVRGPGLVLIGLWLAHYVYRVLIYPLRLRRGARPYPLAVATMAFTFQLISGWLIVSRIAAPWGRYPASWFCDPRFWIGIAIMALGAWINHRSDAILRRLATKSDGYAVPQGFLYRWVSSPNYLGEVIEWAGWAIASWSLAGLAFWVWTFANLVPRAVAHHRWYRQTFADYPSERRAILPGLL